VTRRGLFANLVKQLIIPACDELGLFSSVVGYDEIDTLDAVDTVTRSSLGC
jgi:hypothetical protein